MSSWSAESTLPDDQVLSEPSLVPTFTSYALCMTPRALEVDFQLNVGASPAMPSGLVRALVWRPPTERSSSAAEAAFAPASRVVQMRIIETKAPRRRLRPDGREATVEDQTMG